MRRFDRTFQQKKSSDRVRVMTFSISDAVIEKLEKLTLANEFGSNRSAYVRSLIERAWAEHIQGVH